MRAMVSFVGVVLAVSVAALILWPHGVSGVWVFITIWWGFAAIIVTLNAWEWRKMGRLEWIVSQRKN